MRHPDMERRQKFIDLRLKGYTFKEIAAEMQISEDNVKVSLNQLRKLGLIPKIDRKEAQARANKSSRNRKILAIQLYQQGLTKEEITQQLNKPLSTINHYLAGIVKEKRTAFRNKVIELHNQGLDYKEIAQQLNVTAGRVAVCLTRLTKKGILQRC